MKRVKKTVRYHERRAKARRQMIADAAQFAVATTNLHPANEPTYKEVADPWWRRLLRLPLRRWSVGGKVYPVKRPARGKLIRL